MESRTTQLSAPLLRLALDNLADAVTIHDSRGKLVYVNDATVRMLGASDMNELLEAEPGFWTARWDLYDERGRPLQPDDMPGRRVFRGEEPEALTLRQVDKADGTARWMRVKAAPLFGDDGSVAAAVNVTDDVTDVKEAELFQRLLAEAGAALSASLDYERTLQQVARLAVPEFVDWCGVELVGPGGELEQVAVAHVDTEKVELAYELRERYPPDPDAPTGAAEVVRTGEPMLMQEIPDELLVEAAHDEEHLRLIRALGLRSILILPLRFGEEVIGTMSFVHTNRRFSDAEQVLAKALARRAVVAIQNSRLYSERAHIAKTLQDGLLPPTLEPPPGWEVAVLFRAAGSANEVGGDFYDVVRLDDGWIAFVGDVTGKGAPAAAITARARYTMISIAQMTGDAAMAIQRVNMALTELGGLPFCTLAGTQLRADGAVDVLSAGHPLPFLVGDGNAEPVGSPGPLLGFDPEASWERTTVEVAPGELLVLYSDGVTDAVGRDREAFGDERLRAVLARHGGSGAAELVEQLDRALLDFQDSEQRDDIAVLAMRRTE